MAVMVDWLTFKCPVEHFGKIGNGYVASFKPDGTMEWVSDKRLSLVGSHNASLTVRTCDVDHCGDGTRIQISGNPVKWFQGHNLFGSCDVHGLCFDTFIRICDLLHLHPTEDEKHAIWEGLYTISRVDVNRMYSLGTRENVLSVIQNMERTASTQSGRGSFKGKTLYFKSKRRWQLKAYAKGQEIHVKGHELPLSLQGSGLSEYADDKLRLEFTYMQLELDRLRLTKGSDWKDKGEIAEKLHAKYLERINMAEQKLNIIEDKLPRKLRTTYIAWLAGHDIKRMVSRATYYRHRPQLLEFGIDISTPNDVEKQASNVVPFVQVINMVPAEIPDWAKDTDLIYQPRKFG